VKSAGVGGLKRNDKSTALFLPKHFDSLYKKRMQHGAILGKREFLFCAVEKSGKVCYAGKAV